MATSKPQNGRLRHPETACQRRTERARSLDPIMRNVAFWMEKKLIPNVKKIALGYSAQGCFPNGQETIAPSDNLQASKRFRSPPPNSMPRKGAPATRNAWRCILSEHETSFKWQPPSLKTATLAIPKLHALWVKDGAGPQPAAYNA